MDDRHKRILQRNRITLVKGLDPGILYDGLLEKGVFTQDMIDEIKSSGTRRDQARELVRDLETRGSRAFPLFLECLQETGHQSLIKLLNNGVPAVQPSSPIPVNRPRPVVQPLPVTPLVDLDEHVPDVAISPIQRPSISPSPEREHLRYGRTRRDSIQSYKMDSSPCGHCLIINNVEFEPQSELSNRTGSNIDCDKLEGRFKALNFIVEVKTNLKQKKLRHELSALSKKDHSQYDCCVVIILSHGTEYLQIFALNSFLRDFSLTLEGRRSQPRVFNLRLMVSHNRFPGAVYGVDGLHVPVQHITNYLNGQHCPSLQGKPKLFFIQACGGGERDTGFEVSPDEVQTSIARADDQTDAIPMSSSSDSLSTSDEIDARATLPTPSDILVSYSTFPGYVSWRDTQSGSWYVETLDRILEENAVTEDLVTMLTMVNHEVSQNSAKGFYKQMPGSFNFLRKLLFFQTQEHTQSSS